jgi:hypothetical protein
LLTGTISENFDILTSHENIVVWHSLYTGCLKKIAVWLLEARFKARNCIGELGSRILTGTFV